MTHSITIRRITSRPGPDTARYWFDGLAFETLFFNALSSTFPEGERFFIRSVRAFQDQVHDSRLLDDVGAFVGQEGQHSREHDQHMDLLREQGFTRLDKFNEVMRSVMTWFVNRMPRYSLAITAGIEHITANLADLLMTHQALWLQRMTPDMRLLWHWHAVEEAEHKAVAFDVYRATGGDYPLRVMAMAHVTLTFLPEIFVRHVYMMGKDGMLMNAKEWSRGFRFLWGRNGLLRLMAREHGRYFRRSFHPWQNDNSDQIEAFVDVYAAQFEIRPARKAG